MMHNLLIITRYVKQVSLSVSRKIVSFSKQFFRVLAVLAKGSARAVRNVFCFRAAEHRPSRANKNIIIDKYNEAKNKGYTFINSRVNACV